MKVNGFTLPAALVDAIQSGNLQRDHGSWQLNDDKDAYGASLETELGELYSSQGKIEEETSKLSDGFQADGYYGESLEDMAGPGAIADITDFSRIVCCAHSGDGSPFCLDYRESSTNPSVIWWDDVYWRRVAPNVESFFALFKLD